MTGANGLTPEDTSKLVPTSVEAIKKVKQEDVVELPAFVDGTPFIAKLRRPSLFQMAKHGKFPNPLSAAVDELMDNVETPKTPIEDRAEVLSIVAQAALEDPTFEQVEGVIDSFQMMAIWEYVMNGVKALLPFRAIRSVFAPGADERALAAAAESTAGSEPSE
jgi:hypothetical protein